MQQQQQKKRMSFHGSFSNSKLATGFCNGTSELGLHAVALKCLLYRITLARWSNI